MTLEQKEVLEETIASFKEKIAVCEDDCKYKVIFDDDYTEFKGFETKEEADEFAKNYPNAEAIENRLCFTKEEKIKIMEDEIRSLEDDIRKWYKKK